MRLAALKRKDLTESIMRNQRICNKHFITGKPSALSDENHPDWVPSQHMGHVSQAHSKRKSDVNRKLRADKRTKLNDEACEPNILECNLHKDESDQDVEQPLQDIETCIATQTDLTMTMLTTKLEQLKFSHKKICDLEKKIENSPLGLMDNINNTYQWRYYTSFEYEFIKIVNSKPNVLGYNCHSLQCISQHCA